MKKLFVILLSGFVLLWTLSWCTENSTQTKQIVKIGVVAPISWPAADYGMDGVNTYKYLTDKFNVENKDIQIQLIIEDGKCSGKDATSAAQKLIQVDKVVAILWWSCSAETMAAGKIAQENGVVLVDSVASDPAISDIGDYVFKYINDTYAGKKLADFASKNFKTINLVFDNNDYGVALANVIKSYYAGKIISEYKVAVEEKDLSILAKKIAQNPADGMIIIDQDDTHAIAKIKAFDREWLLGKYKWKILSAYFYSASSVLDAVGDKIEWAMQVDVPLVDNLWNKAQVFVDAFQQKYPIKVVASYIVFQWEAMKVIFDAIKAWKYDSISIQKYLQAIDRNNQRNWLFGNYYFSGSDAVWIKYVIQKVENRVPVIID